MKKFLLLLTLLVSFGGMVHADTWIKVTSAADLSLDGEYIIVAQSGSKAMSTTFSSSYMGVTTDALTISDNKITDVPENIAVVSLEGASLSNCKVKISTLTGESKGYWTTSAAKKMSITTNGTSASITYSSNYTQIKFGTYGTLYYNTAAPRFLNYTSAQGKIDLFKKEALTGPQDYTPSFGDVTLEIGQTNQLELGDSHPEVLFISNDDNIATVDDAGLITAVAAGTTEITAAWDASTEWNEGETTFKVTVTKPLADPQFSFRHDVVYGKLGVGVVGQAGRHLGDGKTTYSSSDETVVTVNPNTGMITPADVHKAGTATITANLAATADYKAATASYTVIIEDPNQGGLSDDDPATFDFTTQAPYGLDPKSNSNAYETEITEITSVAPITLSLTGRYRNWKADNDFRLYPATATEPAATMTFAVPEGFAITKITINQTQGSFTADNGTVGTEYKEWNAETADGAQKVTFTITTQLRIKTMTVGLKKTGSTLLPAQLSFTNKTYNELVNNDIIVNAVNNPNNVGQIYYSIDNLTEGEDYTIMSQGNNLKLNVKEIGVYTLRAKSEATETHLDGFAILRLNVFPQLTMNVDGSEPAINEDGVVLPAEGGKLSLDGEYPNTVKVFYSLNDGEEIAYDGTPIEFTDDAKLTYHMEYAETAAYRHTTNVNVLVTPAAPTYDITEGSIVNEGDIITFSTKEGTTLYYKVAIQPSEQAAAHRAPALEGWTSAEGNTFAYTVPALEEGETAVVTTKAVKGNLESAATTYGVKSGITTGVEAIEAEGNEAEVEWFNLQGVRVENPAHGLYIRRQGNKVEKVAVK